MKFKVSSSALLSHLQAISRVINPKNNIPILDCFLLELADDVLTITAADSETRLETKLSISDLSKAGSLAINAKNLLEPLRELPEQPLTFEVDTDTLEVLILYQNGQYKFMGHKSDEYPTPKELNESAISLAMPADTLFNGINRTVYATAEDELRPVMNGIYFDITDENITFVASDGHKLVRIINSEVKGEGRASFILPKKAALLLKSLLPKESGDVEIKFDENNAYFNMSNNILICRFVEGRFPNYNSVIPQNNPNNVTLDRVSFLNALKRVSVFSNPASSLVKLQLSEDKIVVSAQDIDFMTSAEETILCQYNGIVMNIGFKAVFLIDILNNIPSSEVVLELSDPSRAGIIFPLENEENEDMLSLLMPMMLND